MRELDHSTVYDDSGSPEQLAEEAYTEHKTELTKAITHEELKLPMAEEALRLADRLEADLVSLFDQATGDFPDKPMLAIEDLLYRDNADEYGVAETEKKRAEAHLTVEKFRQLLRDAQLAALREVVYNHGEIKRHRAESESVARRAGEMVTENLDVLTDSARQEMAQDQNGT